jgi:hypothetical protein
MNILKGIMPNTECCALYLIADKHATLPDAAYLTYEDKKKNNIKALNELTTAWIAAGYLLIQRTDSSIHEIHDFVNRRYGRKSYIHDLVDEAEEITIFDVE